MRKLFTIGTGLLLALATQPVLAGDPVYPVKNIPAALKENAHTVKRLDEMVIKVNDLSDVRITRHYIITVLDEAGAADANYYGYYDKITEIRSVSGALYDANGALVKRMKQSDIRDVSAVSGGNLMTDARMKLHQFYPNVYPYTIEYTEERRYNNTFWLPWWQPQSDIDCTVEQSKLTVTVPLDFALRYRSYLYNGEPVAVTDKNSKTYTWEVKQLPALKDEVSPDEFYRRTPSVFLGATDFEFDRFKGNMSSWNAYGTFIYKLNEGRDVLPDNIKTKVHELTNGLNSRAEKINVLYKFMQQNARYISIQLGIGGWQTFDAASVAANGYGDCKALSNYMMALLKEAGIKSNCVLVKAGSNEHTIREDFPSSQFNHVILCVPGAKDTTWLECTSNTLTPGYLSEFTDNRPVLLIDEKDSKLIRTPFYGMDCNQQLRTITAAVDSSGNIDINAVTIYSGLQQDHLHRKIHELSEEKQLEALRKGLDLSSYDITGYRCKELGTAIPAIEEQIQIKGHNYATVTGKRMFLLPDILSRGGMKLDAEEARKSEIKFDFAFRDVDTVNITLPPGYQLESLPAPVAVSGKFGNYSCIAVLKGNTLNYIRRREQHAGVFPATDFPELVKFYATIYKGDRNRLVLVKQ
jgi:transglutaminase-like putative cysteine protease